MFQFLSKPFRRHPALNAASPTFEYDVFCRCGQRLHGQRLKNFQTPPCPACGHRVFVLPRSPLPPVRSAASPAEGATSAFHRRLTWCVVAPAGAILVIVLVALVVLVWAVQSSNHRSAERAALLRHWQAGRDAFHQGRFQQASTELAQAASWQERFPSELAVDERRQLGQMNREAQLLADVLPEPLVDVCRQAARLNALDQREWQTVFERFYRGRSVLLDGQVRPSRDGYQIDSTMDVNGDPGRINIAPLTLLRHLPLEEPRRLLFGARLAGIHLDRTGAWIVELEPDSGVLLTDARAVSRLLVAKQKDSELERLLGQQREWAAEYRPR